MISQCNYVPAQYTIQFGEAAQMHIHWAIPGAQQTIKAGNDSKCS